MWCRNVLRTRTIYNKSGIFDCLQCLTNNNLNVSLKYPARRLLVSEARECTIGDVIDQWSRRFENEGIPEPVESIEHIVAHIIGTKKVRIINSAIVSFVIVDVIVQRMTVIDNYFIVAPIFSQMQLHFLFTNYTVIWLIVTCHEFYVTF